MKIIGITGNIATGKTTITKIFNSKGIKSFNDDNIVNNILNSTNILKYFKKEFKEAIVNNKIDKSILKKIVFNDYNKLLKLESIIHPLVNENRRLFILKNQLIDKRNFIIIDSPLLFEANIYKQCDYVIVTYCSLDLIKKRVFERKNLTEKELNFILKRQLPTEIKISRADFTINTEFSISDSEKKVTKILECIKNNNIT